ncbi:MAG: type I 3-dehydroquinate dehydratase [Phycisphaeraceae bacterium]
MTHLTVPILVQSVEQALTAATVAAENGGDLVEYRVDRFVDPARSASVAALTTLLERSPLPCIVTCRSATEGGQSDADDAARVAVLEHAAAAAQPPAYLDVELATYQKSAALRQRIDRLVDHPGQAGVTSTGLILSSHDFAGRPADLLQRVEAMAQAPACRVVKIVWQARSLRDNLEAFEILAHRYKPTIALCMGEAGLPSRVLARKFGALLTFASGADGMQTAPGQPTVAQLKTLYRWDRINSQTRVYGVIGHPVGHSMSPAIHNAGFDATAFDGVYLPLPIPPEYEHFKATVGAWLDYAPLHFGGASVTIPHKENLLRFVAQRGGEIEPLAADIGAANTLTVRDDGALYASNTDYAAALDAVCEAMGIARQELAGMRVAVLGAGGAARAIVAGFAHYGATVVIYNRTLERAAALAQQFNGCPVADGVARSGKVVAARLEKLCDSCCQVYINCTPIGMHPLVDATPLALSDSETRGGAPPEKPLSRLGPGTVVFDTIYNPIHTRLLREARAAGCLTIAGTEMFVRQARGQFRLWTGMDAPLDVFRRVLLDRLGHG